MLAGSGAGSSTLNTELLFLGLLGLAGVALAWWLLVTTEGVYLGQRVVTALYDLYASRYDRIKGFDPETEAAYLGERALRALRDVAAPLVLDVATGTGRLPLALLEMPTFNGHVWGVDLSRRMLRVAAAKLDPYDGRARLLWGPAERLPFVDGVFDMVTCLEALEFLQDQRAALAEIARVLRPGGVLLTSRRRGRDARLMPGRALDARRLARVLEEAGFADLDLVAWQVDYDLVWARKPQGAAARAGGLRPLVEVMRCPACASAAMAACEDALRCAACGARWPIAADGVIELGARARAALSLSPPDAE